MSEKFKYQVDLDFVREQGICCPPQDLKVPSSLKAYRFAFEDGSNDKNHKPPGKIRPKRVLNMDDAKKCSLYGLSCFTEDSSAKSFFQKLQKNNKMLYKSVGDILSEGTITSSDGLTTDPDHHMHFDLFEFESCDLKLTFSFKERL